MCTCAYVLSSTSGVQATRQLRYLPVWCDTVRDAASHGATSSLCSAVLLQPYLVHLLPYCLLVLFRKQ